MNLFYRLEIKNKFLLSLQITGGGEIVLKWNLKRRCDYMDRIQLAQDTIH